jgi:CubicO group peptidase (beta-lactamase class C family)
MKTYISVLFLFVAINCSAQKTKVNKSLAERIARIENGLQPNFQIKGDSIPKFNIEHRMKELGIPGLSIAILNNGKIEWAKGYGMADSTENRKVTTQTMFQAASISKPVTALRIHQLAEQGVINLDSNINNYLSSWKLPENSFTEKEKVTPRRILNHTAGLTVQGFRGYSKDDKIPDVSGVLDGKGNSDPVRVYKEPGKSWQYSGGGYTIMQLMISDLERKPFQEIMQSKVLNPLGMKLSTFENPLPTKYHSIAATGYQANGKEVKGKWHIYPELAAAGLWTTPSQLILWAKEIQKIQQTQKNGLLRVETINEMLTPGMNNYGLGPKITEHTYWHGGSDEGFRAILTAWKKHPIAVVIMVNSDNSSIFWEIMKSIAHEYNLPGFDPTTRKAISKSIEERKPMVGTYVFPEQGEVSVTIKENGLEINFKEGPVMLLPETDNLYFNKKTGTSYTFIFEGGVVTGLQYLANKGKKIK